MSLSRYKTNDFVSRGNDAASTHQQYDYQTQSAQRQALKSSKSIDGLRRARSHTADSTTHSLRKNFGDMYVDSPSLTQTQLDAYGSSENLDQQYASERSLPSSYGDRKGSQFDQRHEHEHGVERNHNHRYQNQQYQQQHPQPSQQPALQSSNPTSNSPYQHLNVQTSQIASRSTPKLSFFPQTATQSNYTSESKETHSSNGPPGQLDPKPKSKNSKLKPIVLVEETNDDHVERDQYGFKKESQWLSHHDFVIFETYYIPIMERRRQKWAIFMNDSHGELPPRSAKHLHRTFPENINFKSQITQQQDGGSHLSTDSVAAIQSLRRVLLAFSLHCPSIGYCQSLNYIAGMLLLFMNEEQSFWTLSVIIQNFLPEGMYDVTMEGANIDQAVLMALVMERLPAIWAKFSGGATSVEMDEGPGLPTVTLVTSHWFLTLFINILPVESILRVWDCFFYEGRKILFRVALTIMRMHEAEISKIDDPLEVFQVVQNIPKQLIDCHKLMEACFKRMGSFDLTTKDIDRRYDQFRAKRKTVRAAAQASRSGHRDKK
ncbi:hypothetical protein BGZ58_005384 [Dissophora ornata]|nr:hypothetical protein BGZ58_005384 [Dissophora ornata]